ncbi:MAG: hypothetical protein CMK37_08240 [Porticoccaceae bacterium]|nr:hypothetical protein [Porticoccaceae bacterium]
MNQKKWLLTKSNDNCVVIVKAEKKTNQNDFFISQATLDRNIQEKVFIKHETLKFEGESVYVHQNDI